MIIRQFVIVIVWYQPGRENNTRFHYQPRSSHALALNFSLSLSFSLLFFVRSFLVVSAGITSLGGVVDSANLDYTLGVTLVPDRKIALVTSYNLNKLSVFSYVDANNLELLSSGADSTLMLNAYGVSYDNTRDMAVVSALHGNRLTTIDLSDTSSMTILGSVSSSTYLDGTLNSCLDESNAIAYASGSFSDSFAAVSYSDRANPAVLGGISGDSTYMHYAWDVACNLDNSIVYVTGPVSYTHLTLPTKRIV